jgi:hypothetical protein
VSRNCQNTEGLFNGDIVVRAFDWSVANPEMIRRIFGDNLDLILCADTVYDATYELLATALIAILRCYPRAFVLMANTVRISMTTVDAISL